MYKDARISFYVFFDRKFIEFNGDKIEVFSFDRVELATDYIDSNGKLRVSIIDDNGFGIIACPISSNCDEDLDKICTTYNIQSLFESFETVNSDVIKRGMAATFLENQFFVRSSGDKTVLIGIKNESLLENVKKAFGDIRSEFNENILNRDFDISKMYSTIKRTIISQDEQIMQILTSLFKNQIVVNSNMNIDLIAKLKENILIYGPTGTGKTEILKRIAKLYKVPIVIEDVTSLSEIGYVGRDISDMLENLYIASGKQMEVAQKGILVLDEFDKLAEREVGKEHVSRIGVQRSLLKLLDGATLYIRDKKFDTSKLTIVGLGAFSGIVPDDDYKIATMKDFVNYGIMRELMGRFSKNISMNKLTKNDLKKILLESDFSPLNTYRLLLEILNINMCYDLNFIDWIASKAYELDGGARSLKTIFDEFIGGALFQIFGGEYSELILKMPSYKNDIPYTLVRKKK